MDAGQLFATLSFLGLGTKAIVDAIRRYWTNLDGLVVQIAAVAIGGLEAWAFHFQATKYILDYIGVAGLRLPAVPVDYLITGIFIAAGAGFLAELVGKSGTPTAIVEVGADGKPR